MVTSRTGTGQHRKMRAACLDRDRERGVTNCPLCGGWLNYDTHGHPDSAEADEIVPYADGGTSRDLSNWRTVCRDCNGKRGGRLGNSRKRGAIKASQEW